MNKVLIIIVLCIFQSGCAAPASRQPSGPALLQFNELAGEIIVRRETESAKSTSSQPANRSPGDSS